MLSRSFIDGIGITVATCCAVALLYVVPRNFDFLNPLTQAIGDIDITDIVFTQFRSDSDPTSDTSIVIVNIGDRGRAEIATMIRKLSAAGPAAIGIDAFFREPKDEDPLSDAELQSALREAPNVVLVSKVAYKEEFDDDQERPFDTLETSAPMFLENAHTGFANLIVDDEAAFMTVRNVSFQEECADTTEVSFPVRLAQLVYPKEAERALQRNNATEPINFVGGLGSFFSLDADDVLRSDADLSMCSGKIVLLGYLGPTIGSKSFEDNFFTPLNERYVGRSYPDMYGVVIHANVLSMIRTGSFVNEMSREVLIAVMLFFIVLNVVVFTIINERAENWYDTLVIVIQLAESVGILYASVIAFGTFRYKFDPTFVLLGAFIVGPVHEIYHNSILRIIAAARERIQKRAASLFAKERTDAPSKETS